MIVNRLTDPEPIGRTPFTKSAAEGPSDATSIAARIPRGFTARVAKLADAADLGSESAQPEFAATEKISTIGDPREPEKTPVDEAKGQSRGNQDAVEAALAKAIEAAAAAGRFDVVAQLARELEAHRLAGMGNVHTLRPKRDPRLR
jgi:hypothetical protein